MFGSKDSKEKESSGVFVTETSAYPGSKGTDEHFFRDTEGDELFEDHGKGKQEVFGNDETGHQIVYRKLSWVAVSILMIAEIVSNGMLSLPSTFAVIGIVPGVVLIVFLGVFALFTSFLLVDFKLHHPEVHNMGDAGFILFGWVGREVLSAGTIVFAIFAAGTEIISAALSLSTLSQGTLCSWKFQLIAACMIFVFATPRVLNQLNWLGVVAVVTIVVAAIVGMIGAGTQSSPQHIEAAISSDFYTAFFAVTNPTFAYAGHFMFFLLISEMRNPRDAWKSAVVLQTSAICLYVVFSVVFYVYYGADVASPAFGSLPEVWAKATYGVSLANFVVAGALYSHTAGKLLMVRFFRKTRHIHSHTPLAWVTWLGLVFLASAVAFIAAVTIPIFNQLVSLTASLFAVRGFFFLHDYRGEYRERWIMTTLCVLTIVAGAFICVAGCYASIRSIVEAYNSGQIATPFSC